MLHTGCRKLFCSAACLVLLAGLASCAPQKMHRGKAHQAADAGSTALLLSPGKGMAEEKGGRVSPVYEQWLYRQSILGAARKAGTDLAGSRLLWRHTGASQDKGLLRRAAPTWLVVNVSARPGGLKQLQKELPRLAQAGIGGIWLDAVMESDAAWTPEATHQIFRQASLELAPSAGTEKDLAELMAAMQQHSLQCGMDTVPMATGMGPDFMLQARGSAAHRGMYVMAEAPQSCWNDLPKAEGPWDCRKLPAEAAASLAKEKILPGRLRQESLADCATFWAVTGPVLGVDGQTRRLVYRALDSVWQPILCWQDPGNAARQALTGAVIKVTGMRRQTLAGLSAKGLAGLDAAPAEASPLPADPDEARFPAGPALLDLSSQIHRCGGWSLVKDGHDAALVKAHPNMGDFYRAADVEKALANALKSGEAAGLACALQQLAGSNGSALAGSMAFFAPYAAASKGADEPASQAAPLNAREACLAMALPLGLPGLCFLPADAADLAGGAARLAQILSARTRLNAADGTLEKVLTPASGVLVTQLRLPSGGLLVTALNFSNTQSTCTVPLPSGIGTPSLLSLTPEVAAKASTASQLALSLGPRQAAHFLAGRSSGDLR